MKSDFENLLTQKNSFSIKHVVGALCTLAGLFEKIALFIYSLFFSDQVLVNFNNLDSSANWLIGFGGAFLGLKLFEKIFNNK